MVANCWTALQASVPALSRIPLTSTDLPILASFNSAYDKLRADHAAIEGEYTDRAKDIYRLVTGSKFEGGFRPAKLPKATSLPTADDMCNPTSDVHPPRQGTLSMVVHHRRWLDGLKAAVLTDQRSPHPTCRNREAVRFIAVSQEGAGSWIDMAPDGSYSTRVVDADLEVMLQRRGGLHISQAKAAYDAMEREGQTVDRKGDKLANGGEYNRRHNAVNRAAVKMVLAGAVGPVVLGDKTAPEQTAMLNDGHVLDFAEIDGDPDGRGDVIYETKVPSPLKAHYSAGNGSAEGGQPATVGHRFGFGSTLEEYNTIRWCTASRDRASVATMPSTTPPARAMWRNTKATTTMHSISNDCALSCCLSRRRAA
jgi:hypothetical protein